MPRLDEILHEIDDIEANRRLSEVLDELDNVASREDPVFYNAVERNNEEVKEDSFVLSDKQAGVRLDNTVKELDKTAVENDAAFYGAIDNEDDISSEIAVRHTLENYRKKGDTDGIARTVHQVFIEIWGSGFDNEEIAKKMDVAVDFLKECVKLGSYDNKEEYAKRREFLTNLMQSFTRQYYEDIVAIGKKRDEWRKKIKDGQVENTELILDDDKIVDKLAHDINLMQERVAMAGPDCYLKLSEVLMSEKVKIIPKEMDDKELPENYKGGANGRDIYEDMNEGLFDTIKDKYGLSEEKMSEYVKQSIDRNTSSTLGFVVKQEKVGQNESVFSKIPDYIEKINNCKNEEDLEKYEAQLYEKINSFNRHVIKGKSTVKVFKHLFKELKESYNPETKSEAYTDTYRYLEEFTTVGTMYVYRDPDILQDNIKPSSDINYIILDKAAGNLDDPSYNFAGEIAKDEKSDAKLKNIADGIFNVNFTIKGANDEFGKQRINASRVEECEKALFYINKERKRKGYFVADKAMESEYGKALDAQIKDISDSLIADAEDGKEYDVLIKAVMERKRIYHKMLSADRAGNNDYKKRYDKQLSKNATDLKKLIGKCKEFEKKAVRRNITGNNKDRNELLNKLSAGLEKNYDTYIDLHTGNKPNMTESDIRTSISKVLAAYSLKKLGRKFDAKELKMATENITKQYLLSDWSEYCKGERLYDVIKDKSSILAEGERLRCEIYDIKNNNFDKYVEDMKTLSKSMRTANGRSKEYKALYNIVKTASELDEKTKDMSLNDKKAHFRQANIDVINAVERYVKGKEKVRITDKGNEAFDNSMDALSIVSQYTKNENQTVNQRVGIVISSINEVRKEKGLDIKVNIKYGAERAKKAAQRRENAAKTSVKNNAVNKNVGIKK